MKPVSLLSGVTAALGACLFFYGAGPARWIGPAVFAAGAAAAALSICAARRQEKKISALHDQIMDFLQGGTGVTGFSVDDDIFALLENAVVELENRLLLERDNRQKESRKNARFITDVSHQLKTPLAALKLYCEMNYENNHSKHIQKQLVLIERMEHLIYSLLRLEKLRADAYEIKFAEQDLAVLVGQVWEELQPLYPVKKFCLNGNATLRCDGYWIGEALKNILKNSCEHTTPNGTIRISLETTSASVIVTVEDSGGGMPEEELPRLFQRFFRSSRPAPNGGAGIGLAITRTIVEKHHGTVYAENSAHGLKITLCFPILDGIVRTG